MKPPREASAPPLRRVRALLGVVAMLLLAQWVAAAPAAAHAELVSTSPANGATLTRAPEEVSLRFTEAVGLVDGGIELVDGRGEPVVTPEPTVEGSVVQWAMPEQLSDGAYLVTWRVVSRDGHPITGAFSFGVGEEAAPVTDGGGSSGVSWPVTAARFGGYLGFTLAAGAIVVLVLCWPQGRTHPLPQRVLKAGLGLAGTAAVAGFLLQGPYVAGAPFSQLFDRSVIGTTGHSDFGVWTQLRVLLCLALAGILWPAGALEDRSLRWVGGAGIVALATTFTGTGHATTDTLWARAGDAVHVLAAGSWVGGLVLLAVASLRLPAAVRPGVAAITAFSTVALTSVLLLVITGTLNALIRLGSWTQLWGTGYGQVLIAKVLVVAVAIAVAAGSRRRLAGGTAPSGTIRVEAAVTVAVLVLTSVLASIAPPPRVGTSAVSAATPAESSVVMPLTEGDTAVLRLTSHGEDAQHLRLELRTAEGARLGARRVEVAATLTGQDVGPIPVDVRRSRGDWVGRFEPPLPGTWTFTVTVESPDRTALVTTGRADIEDVAAADGS